MIVKTITQEYDFDEETKQKLMSIGYEKSEGRQQYHNQNLSIFLYPEEDGYKVQISTSFKHTQAQKELVVIQEQVMEVVRLLDGEEIRPKLNKGVETR